MKPPKPTPRARCRVGDIVKNGQVYVVLVVYQGKAKLGIYHGPSRLSAMRETWNTAIVRSWPLVGRCRPEPLSAGAPEYIIHPTSETP